MTYRIGIIGGDGIGPDVTAEAVKCVDASGVSYEGVPFDLGWERYSRGCASKKLFNLPSWLGPFSRRREAPGTHPRRKV